MPGTRYHVLYEEDWDPIRSRIQFTTSSKEKWENLIPLFEQISAQNALFIMVWNIATNRIIYLIDKKNVIGYQASNYLAENWVDFTFSKIHSKFLPAVVSMQQKGTKYFVEENNGEPEKFVMNMDFVYKKANGEYAHYLQQSACVEKDINRNPFLVLSYLHDITYLKKNETANLVITSPEAIQWWSFNFDKSCLEPVKPLSKQEKKILAYLAEGKSSKEIATALFISPLTVDKHRRNLLHKTNCIDTTGMITYCKLVGLL